MGTNIVDVTRGHRIYNSGRQLQILVKKYSFEKEN